MNLMGQIFAHFRARRLFHVMMLITIYLLLVACQPRENTRTAGQRGERSRLPTSSPSASQAVEAISSDMVTVMVPSPLSPTAKPPTPVPSPTQDVCAPELDDSADGLVPRDLTIFYSDCAGLWALNGDGLVHLWDRESGLHSWKPSPDGRWVAALVGTDVEFDLIKLPASGGDAVTLVEGGRLAELAPVAEHMPPGSVTRISTFDWLPDGRSLAFTNIEVDWVPDAMSTWNYRDDWWTVPAEGGMPTQRLEAGKGGHFAIDRAGQQVAMTRLVQRDPWLATVSIASVDGSDHQKIFEHAPVSSESDWRPYMKPQWAADGSALLMVDPVPLHDNLAYFDSPMHLLRLDLGGQAQSIIEAGPGSIPRRQDFNAHWSPDGNLVAYLASPESAPPRSTSTSEIGNGAYPAPARTVSSEVTRSLVIGATDGTSHNEYESWLDPVGSTAQAVTDFAWSPSGDSFVYRIRAQDKSGSLVYSALRLGRVDDPIRELARMPNSAQVHWLGNNALVVSHEKGVEVWRLLKEGGVDQHRVLGGALLRAPHVEIGMTR